jgi:hypothetical protein
MLFYDRTGGCLSQGPDANTLTSVAGGFYAGMNLGKNNPAMQDVHNVGPLPAGVYTIGQLQIYPPGDPLRHLGPCMRLTPNPKNVMFGRGGFFFHLDNPAHVGMSSDGCIVASNTSDSTGYAKLQKIDELRAAGETLLTVN